MEIKKIIDDLNSNPKVEAFNNKVEEINVSIVKKHLKQASKKSVIKLTDTQLAYISLSNRD